MTPFPITSAWTHNGIGLYLKYKETRRNFINSVPETHVLGSIPELMRHLKTNVHARQGREREPSYRSYQLPRGLQTSQACKAIPSILIHQALRTHRNSGFEHCSTACEGGRALLPKAPFLTGTEVYDISRESWFSASIHCWKTGRR